MTTSQSSRVRPRNAGRASRPRTSALVTSRSQTMPVGETTSKRSLAMAAPSWTDRMPISTSQTGENRVATQSI